MLASTTFPMFDGLVSVKCISDTLTTGKGAVSAHMTLSLVEAHDHDGVVLSGLGYICLR